LFSRIAAILLDDQNQSIIYAVSRDQTMSVVDLESQTMQKLFPLYEPVEAAVYIKSLKQIVTVGEEGIMKFWDPRKGVMVTQARVTK
jgi:hypothetical protein